ncbi:hypothetical protein B0T22DRAFT_196309 [Podospora appendiculata]|uniref:Uncharacterized protein n=1 Tax=Podospora appendiculata TaxID=314037 RepID=A0AAE0X452_9PEZI|nr:hypothetical protein B0T22DRAFT_196309 [Podospora appendiculata]
MGLRLYQAPVESDIQSKPATDKNSPLSRSIIRRTRLRNNPEQTRRRRVTAATYLGLHPPTGRPSPPADQPSATSNASIPPAVAARIAETQRRGSSEYTRGLGGPELTRALGGLDESVVHMFGERWAHLHAESNPAPTRDHEIEESISVPQGAVAPDFHIRRRYQPPPAPYTTSSMRSTQAPNHPSRSQSRQEHSSARRVRVSNNVRELAGSDPSFDRWFDDYLQSGDRESGSRHGDTPGAPERGQVDGLGDRNRSLSPEGDNVWDTLLTTLTPDPQPPSVGSSFASATASTSASASAAASQSAATRSSMTSFTGPETTEETSVEPPCESGCENSETEGDEDDEMEQNPLARFPAGVRALRRSYADVIRNNDSSSNNNEDPFVQLLGGVGGMQRIVRNLARREDIPDEWWAQVGLSRTLSREASGNEA